MNTRFATLDDLPTILEIEQAAHFHPWPESVLRRYLSKENTCWVLEDKQKIVAYAVNTLIVGEAELLMIAVAPKQQGRGYGRQLMTAIYQYLQSQQAEQWFLDVRESNEKAINLYESMGFSQAGVRTNYYPSAKGDEDALLYALAITSEE